MRKTSVLIVGVLLALMLVGCDSTNTQDSAIVKNDAIVEQTEKIEQKEAQEEKVKLSDLENVFGFADESGKKLITLPNENGDVLEDPQAFNVAVGNNGEIVKIEFVKRQEANDQDNLRQSIYNFDNMAGYIYEAKAGELSLNKTYLLSKDTIMNENTLVKLKSTRDAQSQTEYYKETDSETVKKIETIKNRKITKNNLISETADGAKICLFVFERKEEDMLASIVYIKNDRVIFKDYPAKYDEMSTWRVDAGDEPGLFEVLFLANSDEGLLLGITWAAPEGEGVYILKEVNGAFEETDLKNGRYWAP